MNVNSFLGNEDLQLYQEDSIVVAISISIDLALTYARTGDGQKKNSVTITSSIIGQ